MPNIATVLKQEISRLARKEAKAQMTPLNQSLTKERAKVAVLRREVAALKRETAGLASALKKQLGAKSSRGRADLDAALSGEKWRKDSVRSTRRRFDVTQGEFARLLGVSLNSISGWETGRSEPREKTRAAILELRSLSKDTVQAKLAAGKPKRRRKTKA